MSEVPVIMGRGHVGHAPDVEIQAGVGLPAYDQVGRIDAILDELERRGGYRVLDPVSHGIEPVLAVHDEGLLNLLRLASRESERRGGEFLFADTFLHERLRSDGQLPELGFEGLLGAHCYDTMTSFGPGTLDAALQSAQCALTAATLVDEGEDFALALTRPPGHHASAALCGGSTYLNNAAIASQFLVERGRRRIALLDLDIHHGNGSQSVFYERGDVMFGSVHIDPSVDYPYFCGFPDERGVGDGAGANLNLTLRKGADLDEYLRRLGTALEALVAFGPQALVVSLGLDGHVEDPAGAAALVAADFERIGAEVGALRLPTVALLEGGYALRTLGASVAGWLGGFMAGSGRVDGSTARGTTG